MKLMAWGFMATAIAMGAWILLGAAPSVPMMDRVILALIGPAISAVLIYLTSEKV